jgi:hypothetical protein
MLSYFFTDSKYQKNKKISEEIIINLETKIAEIITQKELKSENYDYIEKKLIIIESLKYYYNL